MAKHARTLVQHNKARLGQGGLERWLWGSSIRTGPQGHVNAHVHIACPHAHANTHARTPPHPRTPTHTHTRQHEHSHSPTPQYGDVIEVIQGTVETIDLPEQARGPPHRARGAATQPKRTDTAHTTRTQPHSPPANARPFRLPTSPTGDPAGPSAPIRARQVDVIISEWMGYFLLRESMLDSVLLARDK